VQFSIQVLFFKFPCQKSKSKQLKEISPEFQAYAICGLLTLEQKKGTIQPTEQSVIAHLAKRNSVIYHCAGCLYGLTITMQEIIRQTADEGKRK
jgi:hypothetical protein